MFIAVIYCLVRSGSKKTSLAVGAMLGGMIMCTSSTFFANPAVDIARIFVGQVTVVTSLVFIVVAVIAAVVVSFVMSWLYPKEQAE
jgi:glycerol uptake facilitator-like aquaporin